MASKRSSRTGPRRAMFLPTWRARKRSSTASGNRRLLFENLEQRVLLAADWQNSLNQLDVSDNGVVTPLDALTVINELNLRRISDGRSKGSGLVVSGVDTEMATFSRQSGKRQRQVNATIACER